MSDRRVVVWQKTVVTSPTFQIPVGVIATRCIPYVSPANRLQTLNIYVPLNEENEKLVGTEAICLPPLSQTEPSHYLVHVHGGAWRDPHLSATSVEPTVAHAFRSDGENKQVAAIVGINYTITKFPSHPEDPYDPVLNKHCDPAREAVHPKHVEDLLQGLNFLRSFGLKDDSYVLTSHSCGACIAFQAILQEPSYHGLSAVSDAPKPAALVGVNGLYDLPALIHEVDPAHANTTQDYREMLTNAFGSNEEVWIAASPSRFDPGALSERVGKVKVPALVVLSQSSQDQLVPSTQLPKMKSTLQEVKGLSVVHGWRAVGYHALAWESGEAIWATVEDALALLSA